MGRAKKNTKRTGMGRPRRSGQMPEITEEQSGQMPEATREQGRQTLKVTEEQSGQIPKTDGNRGKTRHRRSERRRKMTDAAGSGRRMRRRKSQKRNVIKEIFVTFVYLIVMLAAAYLILHYVGQRTIVRGESMDPTLSDGQNLIMDKISYRFHDPERYDIIIFPGPEEYGEHPYYIKRVIGLPGETVQIKDGKVYINDKRLESDVYGITDSIDDPGIAEEPLTLSEDEYFCLGDNRPVSYDSRYEEVGPVKRSEILGKVFLRILPLKKFGWVD